MDSTRSCKERINEGAGMKRGSVWSIDAEEKRHQSTRSIRNVDLEKNRMEKSIGQNMSQTREY